MKSFVTTSFGVMGAGCLLAGLGHTLRIANATAPMVAADSPLLSVSDECHQALQLGAQVDSADSGSAIVARFVIASITSGTPSAFGLYYESLSKGEYYAPSFLNPAHPRSISGSREIEDSLRQTISASMHLNPEQKMKAPVVELISCDSRTAVSGR